MFASYMVNGWIMATIIAVVAGAVGLFVVLRGMSFAAHALPLGAFPGAAAANLLDINPLWGLIAFSGLGVIGMTQLSTRQRRDVATALTLMALLGLGTLFLSLTRHYAQGVYALLFGQLITVSAAEIWPVLALGLVILGVIALSFRPMLLSTLSPDLAASQGAHAAARGLRSSGAPRHRDRDGLARGGRAARLQPYGRPGRRRPQPDTPAGPGTVPLDRARAAHGLGRNRRRLPHGLADRLLRGNRCGAALRRGAAPPPEVRPRGVILGGVQRSPLSRCARSRRMAAVAPQM